MAKVPKADRPLSLRHGLKIRCDVIEHEWEEKNLLIRGFATSSNVSVDFLSNSGYAFDFVKFRHGCSEQTIRLVNDFRLVGICWKFRFHGGLKVWANGELLCDLITKEHANAMPLVGPCELKACDEVCIQVADYQPRWFRWFRPNKAHIDLEGYEREA